MGLLLIAFSKRLSFLLSACSIVLQAAEQSAPFYFSFDASRPSSLDPYHLIWSPLTTRPALAHSHVASTAEIPFENRRTRGRLALIPSISPSRPTLWCTKYGTKTHKWLNRVWNIENLDCGCSMIDRKVDKNLCTQFGIICSCLGSCWCQCKWLNSWVLLDESEDSLGGKWLIVGSRDLKLLVEVVL